MAVQTILLPHVTTTIGCKDTIGSSTRNIPCFKFSGTSLRLRRPTHQIKDSNNRILLSTLPDEVTRKIFLACAQLSICDLNPDCNRWSWVNISYVCSSWRRLALEYQDLWRFIDFSNDKWHAITWRRAKMSCPHVISTVTDQNIHLLHRTLRLAHRIQDIHFKSSIQNIKPLLEILADPHPALESLIVDVHTPRNSSYNDGYDRLPFPTDGSPLKNLTYLELRNAPLYLLTSRCTFLTHFHLHDLPTTERPTLQGFLSMLEQLTQLRFLTLDRAFPININIQELKPISLPRLESINLVGSIPEIASILECIIIPSSTRLIGEICTLSDFKDNIWRLTKTLDSHCWGVGENLALDTLVLTGRASCSRFMDGFQINPGFQQSLRIRGFRANYGQGGAAIDLTISPEEFDSNDEAIITTIDAIWNALFLVEIKTLALQDVNIITQNTWSHFLRTLPSLAVLHITGRAPSGLVWALLLNARSKGDEEAQRPLIEQLKDIYLHNVDCSSGGFMIASTAAVNSHFDLDDSRFLDVLVASLSHRRRLFGLCLRSLSVLRCEYVPQYAEEEVKKAVPNINLVCEFGRSALVKDEDVDEKFPARYWDSWDCTSWKPRHYHRLRTLFELDSDFPNDT